MAIIILQREGQRIISQVMTTKVPTLCTGIIFFLLSFICPANSFCVLPSDCAPARTRFGIRTMSSANEDSSLLQATMRLTSAAVDRAMAAAVNEATSNGWKVTIAICDAGGMPLLAKRLDGAFPASYDIAVSKAKTAAHFCRPTGQLEAVTNVSGGSSRTALLSAPYVLMRGGLPIFIQDVCVGSIGVSGVNPDQDEQIASAAASVLESIHVASRL